MEKLKLRTLYSEEEIAKRITQMGAELTKKFKDKLFTFSLFNNESFDLNDSALLYVFELAVNLSYHSKFNIFFNIDVQ